MPFNTAEMVEFQTREEEAKKASRIPQGKYVFEITGTELFDNNGLPRLQITHRTIAGASVGRYHSEFLGWYASETSESPKPLEERERTIRRMTTDRLHNYMNALADSPTSDQDLGVNMNECIVALTGSDEPAEVEELLNAIGEMLRGQEITGAIKYSAKGDFVNLYPQVFDHTMNSAIAV